MRRFSTVATLCLAFTANAGSLSNGIWSASGCGTRPEPPAIDSGSASSYNRSIAQVNDWQKQIQVYHDCVIREANSDMAAISQAASAEQARINQVSGTVSTELNRGRDKLESSPSLPAPLGAPGGGGAQSYPQY
jgi:hypothetical protein